MQESVHRGSHLGEKTRKFGKSKRERDHEATGRPDLSNSSKNDLLFFYYIYIKITKENRFRVQDYWVSLLHKTLVGRQVFNAKIRSNVGNEDHTYLYCQCASNRHEDGSIVIFGVNLNPSEVAFHLEGINATESVHEYVLTPGFDAPNRMFAE